MRQDEGKDAFVKEVAKQLLPYVLKGLNEKNSQNQDKNQNESAYGLSNTTG